MMAFQLQLHESLPAGLRRIACEEITAAGEELARRPVDADAVHAARKRMKKLRALIRLIRGPLGGHYQHENAGFRDIARQLADVRDADVLLECFAGVVQDRRSRIAPTTAQRLQQALQQQRDRLRSAGGQLEQALPAVQQALAAAQDRVGHWPLAGHGFELIAPGLHRVYRAARRQYRQSLQTPSETHFHEWRKQVKYHWYHVRLLQPSWPAVLQDYSSELKKLSDAIGLEHDLAVLRQHLQAHTPTSVSQEELLDVMEVVVAQQQEQRQLAWALGARIHAESANAFVARMAAYWQARGDA